MDLKDLSIEVNIHHLNNDCLIGIFQFLTIAEKLKVAQVCRRWDSLSQEFWRDVSEIEINKEFFQNNISEKHSAPDQQFVKRNSSFIINVLKKSGPYLKKLSFFAKWNMQLDFIRLIQVILEYCHNLTDISLFDYNPIEKKLFSDEYLDMLFKNNKNLSSIFLDSLCISGYCFSNLSTDCIEKLVVVDCKFEPSPGYFFGFLSQLKNLKVLQISFLDCQGIDLPCISIESLYMSHCESISEFTMRYCEFMDLARFLSKQKKLKKINFQDSKPNNDLLDCIPADYLEEISGFTFKNKMLNSLYRFHNLKYLNCTMSNITDEFMHGLTKFKKLKKIEIDALCSKLTPISKTYFSKLQNIETLKFRVLGGENIDYILASIGKCKNLQSLDISNSGFTNIGIRGINVLSDLIILNVSKTDIMNDWLIESVKKLLKLQELNIVTCRHLTPKFIKMTNDVKSNRKDNFILKITHNNHDIYQMAPNALPLIKLEFFDN